MSVKTESIIDNFIGAIKESKEKTSPYDTTAEVLRVDGDTVWVHIAGGVDETPIRKTINCNKGDMVQLRVGGGDAWIVGNATAPPTDDKTAIIAQGYAINAEEKADDAYSLADNAYVLADTAKTIADDTNQYFWHTEEGTDTGVHITEVPEEEWNDSTHINYHKGGNLLARSNGIAVRNGMTELATFGTSTRVGKQNEANVTITNGEVAVNTPDLQSAVRLTSDQFNQTDIYEGVIHLGGEHGNQEPPTITGFTNDSIKRNEITMLSKVSDATFNGISSLSAKDETNTSANVYASINNRNALSVVSASAGTDSSSIEVFPQMTFINSDAVNLIGSLIFNNHDDPIGAYVEESPVDAVSVPSSTVTSLCDITLGAGVWIIRANIRIPTMGTDRTKYVYANISSTEGSTAFQYRAPQENMIVTANIVTMVTINEEKTYYLNVYQNSGSTKSFVAGGQELRAIRIV